jgi:hypothetical protein
VNQPSQPMVMLTKGQQETVFVKLTEAIESILT